MAFYRRASTIGLLLLVAGSGLGTGCGREPSPLHPPPAEAKVVAVREIGPLAFVPSIRARDGGYSARFGDASVWAFGDTVLATAAEDGERWRSSTWCETTDDDPSDGLKPLTEPLDASGAPAELLPFTDDEAAFNAEHNLEALGEARQRFALWPGPIVVDPTTGEALVFYGKLLCGSGAWDFELVGSSLARWPRPEAPLERPILHPDAKEPTLLFLKDELVLGQGAFVDDGWIYVYCVQTVGLTWPCLLARVRFADAFAKDKWEFWSGPEGWVRDPSQAREVMQAAPQVSVHFNATLGRYLAIYGAPLENGLLLRTAPRPEGPWSAPLRFHEGLAPTAPDSWNYCGLGHAELQQDGGRLEYVTYYRPTGFLLGEMRLVEVEVEATSGPSR